MRWASFLLAGLALATACVVEDKPVIPPGDGGPDAGDCIFCPADKPICVGGTECVQCTEGDENQNYCTDRDQVCDVENQVCVDCLDDAQCTAPTASRCDTGTNECAQCQTDAQCDGVDELPATNNTCDEGTCRECTPETETEKCAADETCNPGTYLCTGEQAGSLAVCDACVADSECGVGGEPSEAYKCIPMNYDSERFPDGDTGFCLKSIELGGSCTNPYRIVLMKPSLSGAAIDDYCGINENLATCPAVRALLADTECDPSDGDGDCPDPAGLCRELPGAVNRCTYLCASIVECDVPGSTCDSSGPSDEDYCGG